MALKLFSIPVFDSSKAEEALNGFCATHGVNHVEKHFVANAEHSFWAIAVTYVDSERQTLQHSAMDENKGNS